MSNDRNMGLNQLLNGQNFDVSQLESVFSQILVQLLQAFFPNMDLGAQQNAVNRLTGGTTPSGLASNPGNTNNTPDAAAFDIGELTARIQSATNGIVPNFPLTHVFDGEIGMDDLHKMVEDLIIEAKDLEGMGQQIMPVFQEYVEKMQEILADGGENMMEELHQTVAEMAIATVMTHGQLEMIMNAATNPLDFAANAAFDTRQEMEFIMRAGRLLGNVNKMAEQMGVDPETLQANAIEAMQNVADRLGLDLPSLGVDPSILLPGGFVPGGTPPFNPYDPINIPGSFDPGGLYPGGTPPFNPYEPINIPSSGNYQLDDSLSHLDQMDAIANEVMRLTDGDINNQYRDAAREYKIDMAELRERLENASGDPELIKAIQEEMALRADEFAQDLNERQIDQVPNPDYNPARWEAMQRETVYRSPEMWQSLYEKYGKPTIDQDNTPPEIAHLGNLANGVVNGIADDYGVTLPSRDINIGNILDLGPFDPYKPSNWGSILELDSPDFNPLEKIDPAILANLTDEARFSAINSSVTTALAAIDSAITASNTGNVTMINSSIETAVAALNSTIDLSNSGNITIINSHIETAIAAIDSDIDLSNSGDITIVNSNLATAISSIGMAIEAGNSGDTEIFNSVSLTAIAAVSEHAETSGIALAETTNTAALAVNDVSPLGLHNPRNQVEYVNDTIPTKVPDIHEWDRGMVTERVNEGLEAGYAAYENGTGRVERTPGETEPSVDQTSDYTNEQTLRAPEM